MTALLELLRPVADELVVALDDRASPLAEAAVAALADVVVRYPYAEPVERPRPWLHRQCTGRWVLSIDDDEVPSRALLDALPELVRASGVTHYRLPRRWLYPSRDRYLDEPPWRPDYQLRLVLNDSRVLRFPGELHWSLEAIGPGRFLETPLYHLDLVERTVEERRAKAARYERLQPGKRIAGRPLNQAYYLPEDGEPRTAPVPSVDRELLAPATAWPVAPARATRHAARDEIDRFWPGLGRSAYRALVELPARLGLGPGEAGTVAVLVRNLGDATWPWGSGIPPEIRVGYRWWRGDAVLGEGRAALPCDVRPGGSAIVPLTLAVPLGPGPIRLEVDLVHDRVRWFGCGAEREVLLPGTARSRDRAVMGPVAPRWARRRRAERQPP